MDKMTAEEKKIALEILEEYHRKLELKLPDVREDLTPIGEIKAVLFDIYGTLLISGSGEVGTADPGSTEELFSEALLRAGIDRPSTYPLSREGYLQAIAEEQQILRNQGHPFPEIRITDIWEELLTQTQVDWNRKLPLALHYESLTNPTAPMPGSRELLSFLKNSFEIGIVSNAQFYTPLILESWNLLDFFDPTLSSWSYRLQRAKPDTELFTPVLKTLASERDIHPEEVVYVGNDLLNDIYTASACGCKTIFFAGDSRSYRPRVGHPLTREVKPDATVTNLLQIRELLAVN